MKDVDIILSGELIPEIVKVIRIKKLNYLSSNTELHVFEIMMKFNIHGNKYKLLNIPGNHVFKCGYFYEADFCQPRISFSKGIQGFEFDPLFNIALGSFHHWRRLE